MRGAKSGVYSPHFNSIASAETHFLRIFFVVIPLNGLRGTPKALTIPRIFECAGRKRRARWVFDADSKTISDRHKDALLRIYGTTRHACFSRIKIFFPPPFSSRVVESIVR